LDGMPCVVPWRPKSHAALQLISDNIIDARSHDSWCFSMHDAGGKGHDRAAWVVSGSATTSGEAVDSELTSRDAAFFVTGISGVPSL